VSLILCSTNLLAAPAPSTNKELHFADGPSDPPEKNIQLDPTNIYVGRTPTEICNTIKIKLATGRLFDMKPDPTQPHPTQSNLTQYDPTQK